MAKMSVWKLGFVGDWLRSMWSKELYIVKLDHLKIPEYKK